MATRPYVPRADGESSIGVAAKKWGNIFAYKIDEATSLGNNAGLGYRQPSTAQSIGDIKYHATLPAGWYLECTTAGNTGSGTLTITSPTVGGTVSDGTVMWTIRKSASTQDLTGYLPLSGGQMTGGIFRSVDTANLSVFGGTAYKKGAQLTLVGKDSSDAPGEFILQAYNSGEDSFKLLRGYPNGTLQWAGNSLDKSAVVAEVLSEWAGYRKYASGLIEQWGKSGASQTAENGYVAKITYPISFTHEPLVTVSDHESYTNFITYRHIVASVTTDSLGNNVNPLTQLWVAERTSTDGAVISSGNVYWHAIGY